MTRFRDLRIATKLLLTILPVVALSVILLFLSLEHWIRQGRLEELQSRMDALANTQGALLTKYVWEFDYATARRLVQTQSRDEGILRVELREATGALISAAAGNVREPFDQSFKLEKKLTRIASGQEHEVGSYIVEYHDGALRREMMHYRLGIGAILLAALILMSGATVLVTRRYVAGPLRRLRGSLEANISAARREPLVTDCGGELGAVVMAYNGLLEETDQRTRELEALNRKLTDDHEKLLLAASVFENTTEGIVVTDGKGIILSVNRGLCAITGFEAHELIGTELGRLQSEQQDDQFYGDIALALARQGGWKGEIWGRRKDGGRFLVLSIINALPESSQPHPRYLGLFSDITELRRKDEHIHNLAYRDGLTGLPNRRLLQDRLDHAIAVAKRGQQQVAVMFVGVDRFKAINDSLGHDVGDRLLQVIAERLKRSARDMDSICRWGGDEFVLVIENCRSAEEVRQVAEKIVASVRGPADLGAANVHVSVSLGISLYPQDGDQATLLMRNADAAMSAAKAAGRDMLHFFDESMNSRMRRRLALETELRAAVERGELELLYQPKFSISGQCLNGLEALVRWRHAKQGLISPSDFIPLAEETGIVIPIGRWVLRETCRQIRRWEHAGFRPVPVAVNLWARHVSDAALVEEICSIVESEGVATSMIEIEVTETAVMGEPERAIALLGLLRDRGFGIAVDDFGTGYSSLSYLGRLPLTTLKIDRSFVQDVEANAEDAEIVRTIIAMANALDLKVVAEGVETEAQLRFLEHSDCDVVQGYLIARPLEAAMVEKWLPERRDRRGAPLLSWKTAEPVAGPAV